MLIVRATFSRFYGEILPQPHYYLEDGQCAKCCQTPLRASFCKYRKSGDSFKMFSFFIFCPNKAFSELFSKIQLKDPKALEFFSKSRKVWESPFWPPAAVENWQKWCIFVSLVLVNAITSSNVLLTFHSTSLALSKTLDYFWKAVKIVLFLAVLVTPLEALERLG